MSDRNRFVLSFLLIASAILLAGVFVELRTEPIRHIRPSHDVVLMPNDEIIPLGLTTIAPEPDSMLAKYHGRIGAQRGVFARQGHSWFVAAIGGLLIPAIFLSAATYLCIPALVRKIVRRVK